MLLYVAWDALSLGTFDLQVICVLVTLVAGFHGV